ncbi:uncharacterized protein CCR75_008295 [Bremia lactucae]|uniref:CID domain-containing protein n=1 Tax=Bremia lactucae TaxID=4779 RepID=A0A976NYM5_BRELC|nr:hypothetical protein CCR75_008295 [Bremia lactucae]
MYSPEKLERLLRQAKVTTQSIQRVSQWMLTHRQHIAEIVTIWSGLIREGETEHQIVYLYVANDAMQVGVRKFGRHIAAAFEHNLVDIFHLIMRDGEEKVKRCAIKVVGIWKERGVVTPPLLAMLENVCAGKSPVVEVPETDEELEERKAKVLQEMTSDRTVEHVLEDMPEVVESSVTTQLATHLQDLVNATISADMLSDRMFQLESSISVFHHACEEQNVEEEKDVTMTGQRHEAFPAAGGIAWSKMDQQVYDLDLDNSRGHVEQYRINLTDQAAKREALIKKLRGLNAKDLFSYPSDVTTEVDAIQQELALEKLYGIACEAEALELKQLEEQRADFRARQASIAASTSDPLYSSYHTADEHYLPSDATSPTRKTIGGNGHLSYRRNSHDELRRHNSASGVDDRYNNQYRYNGQNGRYNNSTSQFGADSPSTTKRLKINHSHVMESQNGQWHDASRFSPLRNSGHSNPYTGVDREQMSFSSQVNRYSSRDQYQVPLPRPGRRTRWDSMPEERSNNNFEARRW